jgi:hypothetical protein
MAVILDQMRVLPKASLYLPMPRTPAFRALCRHLLERPRDRRTLPELALSPGPRIARCCAFFLKETG